MSALLAHQGHHVVTMARSTGVDLTTGSGLDAALEGADAVIDVSNIDTINRAKSISFFTAAATNLAQAAERAGVSHIVLLSIVGVDRIPFGYYEGKLAQENALRAGTVPVTVLRATQFFEFAGTNLARVPGPVAFIPRMLTQPIASSEVADVLAELTTAPDAATTAGSTLELAGPEVHELVNLARRVSKARRMRKLVIPITLPGAAGRPMATGALLPEGDGYRRGAVTLGEWLAEVR